MSSQVIGSNIGTAHSVAYQDRIYVHTYVHTYHISEMEAEIYIEIAHLLQKVLRGGTTRRSVDINTKRPDVYSKFGRSP